MSRSKGEGIVTQAQLDSSPHIVYWRWIDSVTRTAAKGGDIAPLLHLGKAMVRGLEDHEFIDEWDDIHSWEDSDEQSDERPSLWELRNNEFGAIIALMRRRNMLEQATAVDYVG